jgi:RNA polymerase sigma-70 factor (ECF subfamily)
LEQAFLSDRDRLKRFEQIALPHLDAAYNLARWLTGNGHDADDVVQESFMRALKYLDGFHGDNGRSWLLTIVRHTCYSWLSVNRPKEIVGGFDEEAYAEGDEADPGVPGAFTKDNPETLAMRAVDAELINAAIEDLPLPYKEVLILRELEDLSYKEIGKVLTVPLGTVMSRLSRARLMLRERLQSRVGEEG